MTSPEQPLRLASRAHELRRVFDATFAVPPPPPAPANVTLLLVRAGGERLAIPQAETTGFARAGQLVRAPGRSRAFLGLAALHGELYPVWSLAGLLGPAVPEGAAGWLALTQAAGGAPCAFHCEVFERMIQVPAAALAAAGRRDPRPGLAAALAPWDSALVPVADLPALHAAIWQRKESTSAPETSP